MSCHFIDMVCGWEDLAVIVVVSCIMVCQERERGQGEKLLQDEAVRVNMLPLVTRRLTLLGPSGVWWGLSELGVLAVFGP